MSDDPKDLQSWSELPPEERMAMRKAAQSHIWWSELGRKVKGAGPVVTAILACLALWQIAGEGLKEWLSK